MNLDLNLEEINVFEPFNNNIESPSHSSSEPLLTAPSSKPVLTAPEQTGGDRKQDKLELERGSIVRIVDRKNYLIVKIFDVYFNEETQEFNRNYRIREIEGKKIKHDYQDISSEQIKNIIPLKIVKETLGDLEYEIKEDKNIDSNDDIINNTIREEQLGSILEIEDPTSLLDMEDPININEGEQETQGEQANKNLSIINEENENIENVNIENIENENIENENENIENIEDEFSSNEDEFEFTNINNDFDIYEEEELVEKDIIFTENEQEEDIIEEMIRLYPDMRKGHLFKKIKFFNQLKNRHSESFLLDLEDKSYDRKFMELKKKILLKSSEYKPLLKKYMENDYTNKYLIPVVQSNLTKYEKEYVAEKEVELSNEIKEQIQTLEAIDNKFSDDKYLDYDTKQQEKEIFLQSRKIDNEFIGHIVRLDKGVQVIDNTNDNMETFNVLGSEKRLNIDDEHINTIEGEKINNIGYLKIPDIVNNDFTNPYNNIFKFENKSIQELYDKKLDNLEEIELNSEYRYKINSKVKVCINEGEVNKEIIGTIKGTRKGHIYLEPDDKSLLQEDKIFEFSMEDGKIRIEKDNEICNVKNECNTDLTKMLFYKFPETKINDKIKENLLDQIIPSVKQILDRHQEEVKNIKNMEDIDTILYQYEVSYNDLETSNSNKITTIMNKNVQKLTKLFSLKHNEIKSIKEKQSSIIIDREKKQASKNYNVVKNEDIDKLNNYYKTYKNNVFSFDGDIDRIDWLHFQIDNGKLFATEKNVNKKPKLNENLKKLQIRNKLYIDNITQKKNQKIEIIKKEFEKFKEEIEKKEGEDVDIIIKDQIDYEEIYEMVDVTSFNEKGQRMEMGAVLEEQNERDILEPSGSIIYDSIVNFLSVSHKNIGETDDDLSDIRYVLNTLVNFMDANIDISKIDKKCVSLYRDNYKTLASFKKKKSKSNDKKKKPIVKQHQEYNQKNLIYISASYLLIYLQITLKNLMVSPFEKCIPKLSGFPLEDEEEVETFGINYMVCLLSNLKNSKGIWGVLEKRDIIKVNYLNTVKKLLNASLKLRLERRRIEIENERILLDEQKKRYVWNEFRPLFDKLGADCSKSIDLGDTDIKSKSSISKSVRVFKNQMNLCSLCIVDKINNIIESQPLENILYDPLPLFNSCCLVDINPDYDYLSFLYQNDVEKNLVSLIEKSRQMDKFNDKIYDVRIYIKPDKTKNKLQSYARNVYLSEEDIDRILTTGNDDILKNLYGHYIETNIGGKKFYEKYSYQTYAENNTPNEVTIGSKADILLLLSQMKETNMVLDNTNQVDNTPKNNTNQVDNTSKNNTNQVDNTSKNNTNPENNKKINKQIDCLRKIEKILDNEFLLQNEFNAGLVSQIKNISNQISEKEITNLWSLLDNSVTRLRTNLYDKITKNVSNRNKTEIKTKLNNLLNFSNIDKEEENIEENDIIIKKEIYLKNISNKRKEDMAKKLIFNYIIKYCNVLSNINNKSKLVLDKYERLEEKKLIEKEYNFLTDFFTENNTKYFKLLSSLLSNLKQLRNITGYADIYGCNIKIESSIFDYEKSSKLLEINLYYILIFIIDSIDNYEDSIKSLSGKEADTKSLEEDEDDVTGLDRKGNMIRHFVIELIKKIDKDNTFYNKYTQNEVIKDIKTKNEESKDRNLYVMEKLDLEERGLRNLQTKAGLTKYENLATDYADLLKQDEIDTKLFQQFEDKYGSKPSDQQFLDFKIENENNIREENQILKDNLVFAEAEGDDEEVFGQ